MKYTSGVALVLMAGVLWSLTGLAIRMIPEAGTWAILFWRSSGMVPVLVIWLSLATGGHPLRAIRRAGVPGVVGGCCLVVAFAGAIFALQSTTIANAAFLFAASPFLAALLGWLILQEPVRPATWAAMALAAAGMYLMVREGLAAGALLGNAAAILSALGFAGFTVALRWHRSQDMLPAVIQGGLFSMLAALVLSAMQGQAVLLAPQDAAVAIGLGALILALGMALYTLGSTVVPAAELTLFSMLEVLLAPFWVWLFLQETASSATLLGGCVLLAAVLLNAATGARQRARAA